MSGLRHHASFSDDGTDRGWGWRRSHRARQRDRERADAERISELQWQWRSACAVTKLGRMIYTPSGVTTTLPLIQHVDLGPPVTFRVKMRPGQTIADFVEAAPSIASDLNVAGLHVSRMADPHWVRIVLLTTGRDR
jgi:hypothetical protein